MIRTIFFDMGNVLVHFCHERMCKQLAEVCGSDGETLRQLLFDTGLQADFERGRFSEAELHQKLERHFNKALPFDDLLHAGADIFTLNESILPVLDELKERRFRLVLLSNTSVTHLNWVRRQWDILDRFDHLVTSYAAGAIKPEPPIFEAALAVAECPPAECFYTDDIPAYITTARRYGIDAEQFTDTPTLIKQLSQRGIVLNAIL